MTDVLWAVERARCARRLSQQSIAEALGVTQGHYSKVVRGKVPLSEKMKGRCEVWLRQEDAPAGTDGEVTGRMAALAISIRAQCMELMHLAERASASVSSAAAGEVPPAAG